MRPKDQYRIYISEKSMNQLQKFIFLIWLQAYFIKLKKKL